MVSAETHLAILDAADADGVQVTFVARGRIRLLRALLVRVRVTNNCVARVTVPAGIECDGASVPRIFWPIVGHPFAGSSLVAAIVHDYLCQRRRLSSTATHWLYYCTLRAHAVAWLHARCLYHAVALFGPRWVVRT